MPVKKSNVDKVEDNEAQNDGDYINNIFDDDGNDDSNDDDDINNNDDDDGNDDSGDDDENQRHNVSIEHFFDASPSKDFRSTDFWGPLQKMDECRIRRIPPRSLIFRKCLNALEKTQRLCSK